MRVNIRWKLMGSYLALLLVMGGALYFYLNHALDKYLGAEIRNNLLGEARLATIMTAREVGEMRRDAPAIAAAIARETQARATIISLQGEVLGDSDVRPEELPGLENHLDRPEVRQALLSGQGDAIRYSATLRTSMLYVALPFQTQRHEGGILRLALPLAPLDKARAGLHAILGASLAVTVFLSLLLSYVLSSVTSRSLRTMTAIAGQLGRGEFGRRIPVRSRDELGELATVMNEMSARIEGQLERISAEKNRLDTILAGMGEGLMVTDSRGIITLVNPAFHALFAIREEVQGRPLMEITRHPALHHTFRTVVATRSERLEEITLPLGEEKAVLTHWVPLLDEGTLQGVVAVFHDISDLRRLEKIRRDFVANVSHELRTPVTVIKGYAEALGSGILATDPGRAERFAEVIRRHADRLTSLIGDLLALAELESGEIPLHLAPLQLEGLVRHAITLLEQKALARGITIAWSGAEELPAVLADRGKLEQVLVNLLDNAVKYTPENGGVTVSARLVDDMVEIAVADTGIGIPAKDLPRIFERFYRVDAARSREEGGTGLGLAIVKHIVQLHGGSIAVESTPGRGSVFSFTLRRG